MYAELNWVSWYCSQCGKRVYKAIILNVTYKKQMIHDFTNLRKDGDGVLNKRGMFKNILDACQFVKTTDILFVLSRITRKSQRID